MDQRVFLRLENGEIVTLEDAGVPGTSYVVQDGDVASTSYIVQGEGEPNASYVVENGAIPKSTYSGQDGDTSAPGYGEAAVLDDVAVENDGADNVVYIVQQEGVNAESIQYAVVGEAESIEPTYAVQAVDAGNETPQENREYAQVQDMSGIETLSRVATQEFVNSLISESNVRKNGSRLEKESELNRQIHIETEGKALEGVKISFSCQHCGEAFEDLAEFRLHLKNEHGSEEMEDMSDGENELTLLPSCQVCSQTFVNVQELEAHKKVHSGESKSLSGMSYDSKIEQDNRASVKLERKSLECKVCAACFDDKSLLLKHVRSEHSKGEAEESSSSSFSKCPYCHKLYVQRGNNRSMIKHIYAAHPGKSVEEVCSPGDKKGQLEEKINCFACGLGFCWEKSLIRHMKDRHPKLLEEKGDQIFADLGIQDLQIPASKQRRSVKGDCPSEELLNCPYCPKTFLWEKSLKRHTITCHNLGDKTSKRIRKVPVVFCCPHCSLVSKYACAVRKHMERKHSQQMKDINVNTVELPTMEADAAMDIEFKTIDKRPAEVRLNFCSVIYRCPFCIYASKQGSNLIRHLTSVKHGNIFTHEELKEIGITSFKVKQESMMEDAEKLDGTSSKKLPKLKLKGRLLNTVMRKFEILKQRKLENKENGTGVAENEDDGSDIDIDNIIDMAESIDFIIDVAEDESDESVNEEEREDTEDVGFDEETKFRRGLRERKGIDSEMVQMKTKDKVEKSGKVILLKAKMDNKSKTVQVFKEQELPEELESTQGQKSNSGVKRKGDTCSSSDFEMSKDLSNDNLVHNIDLDIEANYDTETPNDSCGVDSVEIEPLNISHDKTDMNEIDGKNKPINKHKDRESTRKRLPKPDGTELNITDTVGKRTSCTKKVISVDKDKITLISRGKSSIRNSRKSRRVGNVDTDFQVCNVCKEEFRDFSAFKQHLPAHVNIKVFFRCSECDCEFQFLDDLKNHLQKEHGQTFLESNTSISYLRTEVVKMDSKPVTTYDCPYCEMLFSQAGILQQHVIIDHTDNIKSACIKQEHSSTSKDRVSATIVSAFNCKYCECFYHNIKDMVKHMLLVHWDVDKSISVGNDSFVRKSARKRRLPKWLEEASDEVGKTKKSRHSKNVENESFIENNSPSKENEMMRAGPLQSNRASIMDKSNDTVMSDHEKVKDNSSCKKKTIDVNTRKISKRETKDTSRNLLDPNKASKSQNNGSEAPVRKGRVARKPESVKTLTDSFETQDTTEKQNKCPHCNFIAKRSSALAFHINFKHANVKANDLGDMEKQDTSKQLAVSPKKMKIEDSTEISTTSRKKKAKDKEIQELGVTGKQTKTAYGQGQETSGSSVKMKGKDNASSGIRKNVIREFEEIEDEMDSEDEYEDDYLEFGDSDDDFKPEKDHYVDSSSDVEDSDNEDDTGKGNISVKFECPYCELETYTRFSLLEIHVEENHPKQASSFSIADVKTAVELDGTVRSSDLVHSCKFCDKQFLSKAHVRAHVKNRHRKKSAAESKKTSDGLKRSKMEWYKCVFCNVVADSKEHILSHTHKQHPLEKNISIDEIKEYIQADDDILQDVFKCPYCEKKCRWEKVLLKHIARIHSDIVESSPSEIICQREIVREPQHNKYQCVYCVCQFDRKKEVITHVRNSHPDQASVTEDDIFEVEISDKVEDHFQCPYCSQQSKYKRCIIRHVGRAHKDMKGFTKSDVICLSTKKSRNSVSEGLVFMCPFCDFDSRWKPSIKRHVDQNHTDVVDFDPEVIPSEYRKKSLINLDENHHGDHEESDLVEYYKCSFCDAVSETKAGVVKHTLNVHPQKSDFKLSQVEKAVWNEVVFRDEDIVYKCPVCSSGSKLKKRIVLHVKTVHPEVKKFRAVVCKADFMKSEGDVGSVYMCKICSELITSTRGVGAHAQQVHGEQEQIVVDTISPDQKLTNIFRCMYCEHTSVWRNAIIKHVEIHHPVIENFQAKDVICEVVQESELSGTGGYQCPYCDTVNHWKKSIIRHMKTVHPNEQQDIEIQFNPAVSVKSGGRSSRKSSKQINCLRCGTICRSMEKMRKHFLSRHPKLAKNFLNKENTEFSYDSFKGRPLDHVCVLCNAKYMWKKSLLVHVKNRHRDMYQVYQALDHVVDIVACAAGVEIKCGEHSVVAKPDPDAVQNAGSCSVQKTGRSSVKNTVVSRPGRCEDCSLVFKSQWAANVHRRLKHGKRSSSKYRFQCSKCSLSFPTQSLHLQHKIRYHRNRRPKTTLYCNVSACNFRCKFSKMLQNHYKNIHNISIPIPGSSTFTTYSSNTGSSVRCEICLRSFSSSHQLKQHVALHKKQRRVRFQCGTCGQQFLTRTLRDSHIETFHLDKAEMCDICGALYAKTNLRKHMKTHDEERAEETECPYCQKVLTARMLNRHMLHEHQEILNCQCNICSSYEESSDQLRYTCSLCDQSFCQKSMLYVHGKLHHVDGQKSKLFYCEACPDLYFLSKRMKDIHCHEHHRKRTTAVPKPTTPVSRSTSTYSNSDPTTHVIHIGQDEGKQYLPKLSESSMNAVIKELLVVERGVENPYKCLLCGRSFSKSKYIKLHIRRAHVRDEDQPYRCKVCGSGFVRLTEFRKHSRSHSDFRPYKCRYCDKAFKQQANLRDHYRVHTNSKEYECFVCKTEFKQRGGLTSHVVFHDTVKPFKCMYCQKGFTTRGELSRHMQKYNKDVTQTSEKCYPCHLCEESFPHYPMLLKHIDAHNPEKPFQCVACKQKFSNYVAMYFHKVKEEHFLLEEIQEGMKDLQKRGRKFRAKKRSLKLPGPEIVYARNQPVTETIYISQPDAYAENETSIKPVEVIIEEFGQDQVVRVQENEPEHEELLSIAKQLTELSGFHGSEYYTNKKNVHQEEDEIIKNMLDADEDVLANLSKQSASNKTYDDESDNTSKIEMTEQQDVKEDGVEENYEYMPEIENAVPAVDESAAGNEDYSYVVETGGQVNIPATSIPTNMEELVSLVSQNTSTNNSEQVMAYQSEDGSVIYVCLPEDQNIKTEEVVVEEATGESDMVGETSEDAAEETGEADFNMECNETADELYEETGDTVTDEDQIAETTGTAISEEQAMETDNVDMVHIAVTQQAEPLSEIQQSDGIDVQAQDIEDDDKRVFDEGENNVTQTTEMQPFEGSEIQMTQFITTEQNIPVTSVQQVLAANHLENDAAHEAPNQDYTMVESKFDNSVITIQPQETFTDDIHESHEDLIRRSQLAQHLTGNIQPREDSSRIQTHLIVTEQGLQSIGNFEPLVSQDVTQGENISQSLITIAATAADQTHIVEAQDSMSNTSSFAQVAVTRHGESFVEGEETLVEYQIDESRFIKEELLAADYNALSEKDREVMFFSDNIYTYSQLEKKFICLHCGAKIGTFKNLKNHIRRHAPMSSRTHVCAYCPKRFVTKNELKRHQYTHTGERNYECKDCGKKFIQPGHLQEHQRLHTGHKPFQCTHCPAAFITKSQLVLHFSRLHSSNEIPCSKCDKVFKNDVDLRRHKGLEHSGVKVHTPVVKEDSGEHVCDICGQSFSKKASLKRHLEKHNFDNLDDSEKVQELFACDECGLSFKSKYYVKEHYKVVHSKELTEVCELCGESFKTKSILRRHKVCKHSDEEGNRKWHCDICNKSLGSKYAYGYHMGSKHSSGGADD